MTVGAEDKKKLYILIALLAVAGYFVYANVFSTPDVPVQARVGASTAVDTPAATPAAQSRPARAPSRNRSDEFHPVYLAKRVEDRPDPTRIDPTLRLDLLAKVQDVGAAGGNRNLFQFSQPAPKENLVAVLKGNEPKVPVHVWQGPKQPPPPAPPPPPPPPPPITLKFYGYATTLANGRRMGYFLDGDDILLATEGDTLKRRYKVVRIGPTSAVLEDLDAKRQQSVPLVEEGQG